MLIKPDSELGLQILEIKLNPEIWKRLFFDKIGGAAKYVGKRIENMGDKLYYAGSKIYNIAKASGSYIAEKKKETYKSEFVQNMSRKTGDGINNVYQTAKSYIIK